MNMHPLRRYREAKGLTLEAMANMLRVSGATISRIENGSQDPSMELLRRIVEHTDVKADDFLVRRKPEAAE